jgi:hypothetical protein
MFVSDDPSFDEMRHKSFGMQGIKAVATSEPCKLDRSPQNMLSRLRHMQINSNCNMKPCDRVPQDHSVERISHIYYSD